MSTEVAITDQFANSNYKTMQATSLISLKQSLLLIKLISNKDCFNDIQLNEKIVQRKYVRVN